MNLLGLTMPEGILGLEQGFLGNWIGQGIGSLFGDANGMIDLGGNNYWQSGKGFMRQAQGAPYKGQAPMAKGFGMGDFIGSLFGGGSPWPTWHSGGMNG